MLNTYYSNLYKKTSKSTDVRKAAEFDGLSGRFLRDGSRVLSKPISDLCNLSIKVPDSCNIAKLTPLFKKGSKTNHPNYRRISLFPLISKIIEKVVYEHPKTFLSNNELLYTY